MYETSNDFKNNYSIAFPLADLVQPSARSVLLLYDDRVVF